ncbi:tryptophan RNA-binding attenuator protein-like domain-containing protein [Tribonema minus]|uniref:Tryptophan RNA-binding attenuator protein-like domain-containing protein n=1 Tax=Tribonema minus TaxID=303371 RepID=A0A835Z6E3_9STRA|nr:tryptophan RNA-binding attenuator protein-like domain-containing protein [Tribonema minus]
MPQNFLRWRGTHAPDNPNLTEKFQCTTSTLPCAAKIEGNETQVLTVELQRGQRLRAEAGNLIYMTEGVVMDTSTGGGVGKALSRVITGQSVMVTDFFLEPTSRRTSSGHDSRVGQVCLGTSMPAKILRLPLADFGGSVVCQRGAFLAGSDTIDISTEVTRPMAGLFGGEGFVLQRLSGEGDAFVSACGHVMRRDLKSGEVLRVTAGSLVCFSSTVDYGVTTAGGLKNIVFGTDGVFLATLTGPGTVYLQGMPFDRLVRAIGKALPQNASGMPVPPIIIPGMGGGDSGNAPPGT